jgi:hypothetical protein
MPSVTAAAVELAAWNLCFSTAILAIGASDLHFPAMELQTSTAVALVFGNQPLLYALRERSNIAGGVAEGVGANGGVEVTSLAPSFCSPRAPGCIKRS